MYTCHFYKIIVKKHFRLRNRHSKVVKERIDPELGTKETRNSSDCVYWASRK